MEISIARLCDSDSSDNETFLNSRNRKNSVVRNSNRLYSSKSKHQDTSGDIQQSRSARLSSSSFRSTPKTTDSKLPEKWAKPRKKRQPLQRSQSSRSPVSSSRKKSTHQLFLLPDSDERRCPYEVSPAWEDFCEQVALMELKFQAQEHKLETQGEKIRSVKRGTLDLPCSITFSRILGDFSARFEHRPMLGANLGLDPVTSKPSSAHSSVRINFHQPSEPDDLSSEYLEEIITPAQIAARRRWKMLRIQVREMALEKRRSRSTFNWTFLRHTLTNMSNKDKGRMELYDKYIRKPDDWLKNFQNELPESFHKLHESNLWRRKARRPRTSVTVSQKLAQANSKKTRPFSSVA